jgi:hypothetical protein
MWNYGIFFAYLSILALQRRCFKPERPVKRNQLPPDIYAGYSSECEVEKIISVDKLPSGVGEVTWLRVEFKEGELVAAEIDAEETARVKARITDKAHRLRQRGRKTGK